MNNDEKLEVQFREIGKADNSLGLVSFIIFAVFCLIGFIFVFWYGITKILSGI
jgi:hypothetical protein